jgi:uroporphyrinogen decarboxylase
MNSRERIMAALALKEPDRVPFADYTEEATRKMVMGKDDFSVIEFAQTIGFDAINLDQDYTAPVFCRWQEMNGHRYMLDGLLKTDSDLDLMVFPDPKDDSFYDPAKGFVEENFSSGLAIYANCRFGITGVLYSMGLEALSTALYENPALIDKILDRYVEWNCLVVERLNTIGIDFIMSYDNIAYNSGPMVSPQVFREVFVPKVKQVSDACKLPWVSHICGNIMPIFEDVLAMGVSGIHPIEPGCMDLKTVKDLYGSRVCLWGNIDLNYTLTRGTPEEVETEVRQRIREAGPGGGYILGSGCDLPEYCKVENIWAMAKAVKKYGSYPLQFED